MSSATEKSNGRVVSGPAGDAATLGGREPAGCLVVGQ
jgi:hypothetical protein